MRAVLCYGATERNGGMDEAAHGLEECHRFLTSNHRPLVRGVVGLHASFTVSDETIREAVTLARALSTVLHLHVAEDRVDVHDALERGYAGVVDRLDKLGAMIPGSIFAHGVHLTVDEVERCAANGCWLVQNPRSNRGNRVGYPTFLAHSDRVALGTDGFPADMRAEEEVLLDLANRADDDLTHARSRLEAGQRLIEERFGNGDEGTGTPPARLDESPMRAIRDEAEAEAERLWERMRDLPPRPGEKGDDPP